MTKTYLISYSSTIERREEIESKIKNIFKHWCVQWWFFFVKSSEDIFSILTWIFRQHIESFVIVEINNDIKWLLQKNIRDWINSDICSECNNEIKLWQYNWEKYLCDDCSWKMSNNALLPKQQDDTTNT